MTVASRHCSRIQSRLPILRYYRTLLAHLEAENLGWNGFCLLAADNDCRIAEEEDRAEVRAEVGAIDTLVLEVVRLEQASALGAEDVSVLLLGVRVGAESDRNHWLLVAHHSRAEPHLAFQNFPFHLLKAFDCLDEALVELGVQNLALLINLLLKPFLDMLVSVFAFSEAGWLSPFLEFIARCVQISII